MSNSHNIFFLALHRLDFFSSDRRFRSPLAGLSITEKLPILLAVIILRLIDEWPPVDRLNHDKPIK